ncbi:MAG: hypothetical protein LBU27_09440 [Candidatus Peribacteria bacterium]|nr:hypothetical protein [Candidatus Peribacteria bacterium]
MKTTFPSHFQSLLREYSLQTLSPNAPIVIERVLQLGEMKDYHRLSQQIGKQVIMDFFVSHRTFFDPKTTHFWEVLFELPHLSSPPSLYEQVNRPFFRRRIG